MAVKKTELYSSLLASCDALRGGMDASQYKDYVLTLLFMKYVTDKYLNDKYGEIIVFDKEHDPEDDPEKRVGCSFEDFIKLKENKHIGEGMDKIIARLKEVNTALSDVIGNISFNDEQKMGKGKEMVEKLTELIAIFQRLSTGLIDRIEGFVHSVSNGSFDNGFSNNLFNNLIKDILKFITGFSFIEVWVAVTVFVCNIVEQD
jgi:type I restriction-modification system DNA methylase subunit